MPNNTKNITQLILEVIDLSPVTNVQVSQAVAEVARGKVTDVQIPQALIEVVCRRLRYYTDGATGPSNITY